jgi:hypothetical protein
MIDEKRKEIQAIGRIAYNTRHEFGQLALQKYVISTSDLAFINADTSIKVPPKKIHRDTKIYTIETGYFAILEMNNPGQIMLGMSPEPKDCLNDRIAQLQTEVPDALMLNMSTAELRHLLELPSVERNPVYSERYPDRSRSRYNVAILPLGQRDPAKEYNLVWEMVPQMKITHPILTAEDFTA